MRKWMFVLMLLLFLTGCQNKTEDAIVQDSAGNSLVESGEFDEEETSDEENLKENDSDEETMEENDSDEETVKEDTTDAEASKEGEYFPTSSTEIIPNESLLGMSAEELKLARTEIYKRNDYDETAYNAVEKHNIEKIKAVEGRKRLAAEIPVIDTIAVKRTPDDVSEFHLEDGCVYYYINDQSGWLSFPNYYDNEKLEGIDHVRRMKSLNRGSGVDMTPCLITESGEVYWVENSHPWDDEEPCLSPFGLLKGYAVEDIIDYSGEWQYKVEVLLKDGSIIYLESEPWG